MDTDSVMDTIFKYGWSTQVHEYHTQWNLKAVFPEKLELVLYFHRVIGFWL